MPYISLNIYCSGVTFLSPSISPTHATICTHQTVQTSFTTFTPTPRFETCSIAQCIGLPNGLTLDQMEAPATECFTAPPI